MFDLSFIYLILFIYTHKCKELISFSLFLSLYIHYRYIFSYISYTNINKLVFEIDTWFMISDQFQVWKGVVLLNIRHISTALKYPPVIDHENNDTFLD